MATAILEPMTILEPVAAISEQWTKLKLILLCSVMADEKNTTVKHTHGTMCKQKYSWPMATVYQQVTQLSQKNRAMLSVS